MNKFAAGALVLATCYVSSCSLIRSVTGKKGKGADSVAVAMPADTVHAAPVIPPVAAADTVKKAALPSQEAQMITMLAPVVNKRLTYQTFKGKAKMRFEGPDQKQEFTAHIRVRKDSVIWVNITALGGVVQAARIFITPDSFFLVNYQDKEATRIALKDAAKILPSKVDFTALENFIVGDPLRGGNLTNVTDDGTTWTATLEDTAYIQQYTYSKHDTDLVASRLNTHSPSGPQATTQYSSYMNTDGRKISSLRMLNIEKGRDSTYSLDMNFTNIDFDQPLEYPFSIPAGYTVK